MTSKTEIVAAAPAELELQSASTAQLREQLRTAIGVTENAIRTVAMIWRELVRRGEDMSEFRMALSRFFMPVAEGRLLPALVVRLSGQPRALERLAELPIDVQQALVQNRPVEIYRGEDRVESLTLDEMTWGDVALAIREGRIWSAAEQRLAFQRSHRPRRPSRRGRPYKIDLDGDDNLTIGKVTVPVERVIALLREKKLI